MKGDAGFPVRIRFQKRGPVRFIGHRDVARNFERAFRIEQLQLAFTLGFAPRPKVGFGLALSVGHESDAEYLDVELTHDPAASGAEPGEGPIGLDRFPDALSAALPEGIEVTGVAPIADRAPSLQEAVTSVEYRLEVAHEGPDGPVTPDAAAAAVASVLEAPSIEINRTRKGREVCEDVRPAIRAIELLEADARGATLRLELTTQPRNARPGDVVAALNAVAPAIGPKRGTAFREGRVLRTHQWIERLGARLEPLEADPRAPVLEARAS